MLCCLYKNWHIPFTSALNGEALFLNDNGSSMMTARQQSSNRDKYLVIYVTSDIAIVIPILVQ